MSQTEPAALPRYPLLTINDSLRKILFAIALGLCLSPWVSSPIALLGGFAFSLLIGHPFAKQNSKATGWLLKIAIVGMGFGMNLESAMNASKDGVVLTIFSIVFIMGAGWFLGKTLGVAGPLAYLVSVGTAICGGSAIAATSPVVNAKEKDISVALGIVFLLNSVALITFPYMGHWLSLSQHEFGLWSAIAIHDTSSVVGAGSVYGPEALEVATTVKLARALWIIPIAIFTAFLFKNDKKKVKIPWFIFLFLGAMLLSSYVEPVALVGKHLSHYAKAVLVLTLFLIGAGLSIDKLKAVGYRPLLLGLTLWVLIGSLSLLAIKSHILG